MVANLGHVTLEAEASVVPGKGKLIITGRLEKGMEESGQAAMSYVRSRLDMIGVSEEWLQTKDVHVHFPEFVRKDGPSAGVTMVTAIVSALMGVPVDRNVAMTGEITLRGRVLPIGGLKEKLLAAHRAGLSTVILPAENRKDLREIPRRVLRLLRLVLVEHIDEVLREALKLDDPETIFGDRRSRVQFVDGALVDQDDAAPQIAVSVSEDAAAEIVQQIQQQGRQAKFIKADLSIREAYEPFVEAAWQWQQGVDIWINNAGVDVLTGTRAEDSFEAKLEQLWRVDVLGTIGLSRLVGQRMREVADPANPPVILNVGWDQAERGMGGDSGEMFAAIKGAVMAFSRSLAQSLAPEVRVNCLAPGWIKTAWGEQASAAWQERAVGEALLQRWGTPQDVATVTRFLASSAAAFVTGQVIPINGGFRYEHH